MKLLFLLCLLLTTLISSAQSNQPALCSLCVDGLQAAAFNQYGFSSDNQFQSFLSTYFSMTDQQRLAYRNSSSTSAGIKAVIDAIPLGFNLSSGSSSSRDEYKRLEQIFKQNQAVYSSDLVSIYTKIVDSNSIRAYENCITTCIRSAGGANAIAYTLEGDEKDEFILTVNWRPVNAISSTTVSSFQFTNLMLKNGASIYNGALFKAFTSMTQMFKRIDPTKPAVINLAFTGLGAPISLSLDADDRASSGLPVGTLIASTLDYQQFTGQTFDDKKSVWAPADGRSVANSFYGKKINPFAPDLRGQFIRGFNQFYSPGEPPAITNGADSNDRRLVNQYSYQTQSVQPHTHPVSDPGHAHVSGLAIIGVGGSGTVAFRPYGFGTSSTLGTSSASTGVTVQNNNGAETRPSNVSVFYYIKIN